MAASMPPAKMMRGTRCMFRAHHGCDRITAPKNSLTLISGRPGTRCAVSPRPRRPAATDRLGKPTAPSLKSVADLRVGRAAKVWRISPLRQPIVPWMSGSKPARPAEPPAPKPTPIAVIAAGTPIEDVIAKLTEIQADHPGPQIHQGKRNRREIWPSITHLADERYARDMLTSLGSKPPYTSNGQTTTWQCRQGSAPKAKDLGYQKLRSGWPRRASRQMRAFRPRPRRSNLRRRLAKRSSKFISLGLAHCVHQASSTRSSQSFTRAANNSWLPTGSSCPARSRSANVARG